MQFIKNNQITTEGFEQLSERMWDLHNMQDDDMIVEQLKQLETLFDNHTQPTSLPTELQQLLLDVLVPTLETVIPNSEYETLYKYVQQQLTK